MASVLVVDDSHVLRRLVEIALEPLGLDVSTAGSVTEAQDCVEAIVPDVVLLDVGLPDGHGISVLEWMRRNPRYDGVSVVMASGYAANDEINAAMAAGASGYLTKPFSPDDVRAAVLAVVHDGQRPAGSGPIRVVG